MEKRMTVNPSQGFEASCFGEFEKILCAVCVDAGWLKQPHLARGRLIRLWGWVRPHSCPPQVGQAITTRSGRALLHGSMEHQGHASTPANLTINRLPTTLLCGLCYGPAQKAT
ncbi:unnamed protein product [Boreogadus saida]